MEDRPKVNDRLRSSGMAGPVSAVPERGRNGSPLDRAAERLSHLLFRQAGSWSIGKGIQNMILIINFKIFSLQL
jgi:hypothetical protein